MFGIVADKETEFCCLLEKTDDGIVQTPTFIEKGFRVMNEIECLNHEAYQVNEFLFGLNLIRDTLGPFELIT